MRRRATNTTFREALGLSTSKADLDRFKLLREFLRAQVRKHFDYTVPYQSQRAKMMALFDAEVCYIANYRAMHTRV